MLITINYKQMYFFCEDVKVYNYEYYCHCTRNPHKLTKVQRKHKAPKIDIISSNIATQTKQTKQSLVLEKQPSTLLQRLKRRLESTTSIASLEVVKSKSNTNACSKPTNSDESIPFRLEGSLEFSQDQSQSQFPHSSASPNFSFCLPKQVLISHTFNEQYSEQENHLLVEEQSQLILPTLEGKFTHIKYLHMTQKYEEKLAVDISIGFVVSIKVFLQANSEEMIHKELQIYNKLGQHQNILELYQTCFDSGRPTFVRQAYSEQHPTLASRQQILKDIGKALHHMEKIGIYMKKMKLADIKDCFGVWKIASFQNVSSQTQVSINENLSQLLSQLK